jgi:hypothetical protein
MTIDTYMHNIGTCTHTLERVHFFPGGREVELLDFCCSQIVLIMSVLCSHQIPNGFLSWLPSSQSLPSYVSNRCPVTMSFALILVNNIMSSQKQEITTYLRVFWNHPNPD